MTPSTPAGSRAASWRRSSSLETPPLAMTGFLVRPADLQQQGQVGAGERAVAQDVGDDVPGAAGLLQPVEHLEEVAALPRPAARGELVAAHVEPDRDPVAVLGADAVAPLRVLQRGGAEVDPGRAGRQRRPQRRVVADAAGQLDLHVEPAHDVGEQLGVGAAAERGVEVDEVDPLGALPLPGERGLERVAVVRFAAGGALNEADRLAVGDVDGGQEAAGPRSRSFGQVEHDQGRRSRTSTVSAGRWRR